MLRFFVGVVGTVTEGPAGAGGGLNADCPNVDEVTSDQDSTTAIDRARCLSKLVSELEMVVLCTLSACGEECPDPISTQSISTQSIFRGGGILVAGLIRLQERFYLAENGLSIAKLFAQREIRTLGVGKAQLPV